MTPYSFVKIEYIRALAIVVLNSYITIFSTTNTYNTCYNNGAITKIF